MKFHKIPISLRINQEIFDGIGELLVKYPQEYSDASHVVRCAIIALINERRIQDENENRRLKNK